MYMAYDFMSFVVDKHTPMLTIFLENINFTLRQWHDLPKAVKLITLSKCIPYIR